MSLLLPRRAGPVLVVLPVVAGLALVPPITALAAEGSTVRVSVAAGGGQSTGFASLPAMSSDGTTVLFSSDAGDLVPGVTRPQLYVHDLGSGATELVTVSVGNTGSTGSLVGEHDIDADGSLVVFDSTAPDLSWDEDGDNCTEERHGDEEDVNCADVFARDRADGQTFKLSVGPDGEQADGNSVHPRVSDDGRRVVFASEASNLVAGDTVGSWDIFVRDLQTETTRRLTSGEVGVPAGEPVISADGTTVAFWSSSSTLDPSATDGTNIFVYDLGTNSVSAVPGAPAGTESFGPTLSGDGRLVGFLSYGALIPQDVNPGYDLYVHDRGNGSTMLANWNDSGGHALNADRLELSDDGQHALFRGATGLVPGTSAGKEYVYVRDLSTGAIRFANVSDTGVESDQGADTGWRSLSPDGSRAAFMSRADNLVAGDTNGTDDIFVRVLDDWLPPAVPPGDLDTTLDGSGTTVSTGAGATIDLPVVAALTPPAGLAGRLTVDLRPSDPAQAPTGFAFFGQELAITGPDATAGNPYTVAFTVDASLLGPVQPGDVQVFRNGSAVADCTTPTGAVPDPCVADRVTGPGGDAIVTVRTSRFSSWAFGRLAYAVSGPFSPVDALPVVNRVKAGSAVPVMFRLGGNRGLDVLAAGYPRTTTAGCAGSADDIEQTVSPGSSVLSYDSRTATYTYVWKTARTVTGCRDLVLGFRDGTELTMRFNLR